MYGFIKIENNPRITHLYSGFTALREAGFQYKGESHDFWELVCVTGGKLQATAGEHVYVLEKGQAMLHNPMQFHTINCSQGSHAEIIIFSFKGRNIPALQNNVCNITDLSEVKKLFSDSQKAFNFKGIYFDGVRDDATAALKFVKRLELFLLRLSDNLASPNELTTQGARNYNTVIHVLSENIDKRLSVKEIAELCNMSAVGVQKTFSRYAGIGVMEYFNRLKIAKAKELLAEGCTVKETSLKLGFYDPNYFSTVFKRITGATPETLKVYKKEERP